MCDPTTDVSITKIVGSSVVFFVWCYFVMVLSQLSKPSREQDKSNYPNRVILENSFPVGNLEKSGHEVVLYETKFMYIFHSFDVNSKEGYGNKIPFSVCVHVSKSFRSYFLEKEFENLDFPQITWTYVPTFYQGKGYGQEMYKFLVNRFNGIWCDGKHTEGAKKLWIKLCNEMHVSLVDFSNSDVILVKEATLSPDEDKWYSKKELLLLARK